MSNYQIHDGMRVSPTECAICSNQKGPGILMLVGHPDTGPAEMYVGVKCCFVQIARDLGYIQKDELKNISEKNRELREELKITKRKLTAATDAVVNEFLEDVQSRRPSKPDPVGVVSMKGKE